MPEISRFFGIIIRMYFEDHNPPHVHVEYQGEKALFDFNGNILRGRISSKIAVKLVREWTVSGLMNFRRIGTWRSLEYH